MTIPAKQRSEILRAQTYKGMTHDDFVRLVTELAEIDGAAIILGIPGVWEILSEHYNNDALDLWTTEQEVTP